MAEGEELRFPPGACFGCSPTNEGGLRLRFFRDVSGVRCETRVAPTFQGAADVVHGGIQAVLLDETCCAAAFFTTGTYVVTGALDLRYRRSCPIDTPLVIRATILEDDGRRLRIRGEIFVDGEDGPVTFAEGKFYRDRTRPAGDGGTATSAR
jgi:acyl-coenzyme A thioesterase PaaI-like protein